MIYCEKEFVGKTFSDFLFRPQYGKAYTRRNLSTSTFLDGISIRLELPIISANMDTVTNGAIASLMNFNGGMGIIHRNCSPKDQAEIVKGVKKVSYQVGAAVGTREDVHERIDLLTREKVDLILFDIAHAHSINLRKIIEEIETSKIHCTLAAGNVATYDGARFLADLGFKVIKVGIGPGAACTTRSSTGMGVPQLQAIREVWQALRSYTDVSIIADGGIKEDKDIFLALACGADAVMLGKMIAMTRDAAEQNGNRYLYRGMASKEARQVLNPDSYVPAPEGIATETIPFSRMYDHVSETMPTLLEVCDRIKGHLQSSLSYAGVYSIEELHQSITPHITDYLIPLSEASRQESFVR